MNLDEERLAFYFHLGRATEQWSYVELHLALIVAWCFHSNKSNQAIAGYQSIENFRSRLGYVDAVLHRGNLPDREKENWAILLDRCQQLAKKRNVLAHGWVFTDGDAKRAGRRVTLTSKFLSVASLKKPYAKIGLRDVVGYGQEFSALSMALMNFHRRLSGKQERFPESEIPPLRPPTIAEIRREIYASASRPPRSSRA